MNATAFDNYAKETAKLFVSLCAWYYMPASVHKVLIHGSAIVSAALLPIGQLSDEAQEARKKDIKKFREHYTRKLSRESTNLHLMQRLMLTSDPVSSSLRNYRRNQEITSFSSPCSLEAPPSLTSGASASTSATVINPSDSEYSSSTESE